MLHLSEPTQVSAFGTTRAVFKRSQVSQLCESVNLDAREKALILDRQTLNKIAVKLLSLESDEHLVCLFVDEQLRIILIREFGEPGVSQVLVSFGEIYRAGIKCSAAAFALIHNHPSGHIEPSRDDISLTRRIAQIGDDLNMHLIDHLIVAGGKTRTIGNW